MRTLSTNGLPSATLAGLSRVVGVGARHAWPLLTRVALKQATDRSSGRQAPSGSSSSTTRRLTRCAEETQAWVRPLVATPHFKRVNS